MRRFVRGECGLHAVRRTGHCAAHAARPDEPRPFGQVGRAHQRRRVDADEVGVGQILPAIGEGESQAGLEQFLEMLRRDRGFAEGLPRKALIDAFRVIEDEDLVGAYRRKMATVLF